MHPQALALRSYHFQKVGKKPELTLIWEPKDPEQEPARQVRAPPCSLYPRVAVSLLLLLGVPLCPPLPPALPSSIGSRWSFRHPCQGPRRTQSSACLLVPPSGQLCVPLKQEILTCGVL